MSASPNANACLSPHVVMDYIQAVKAQVSPETYDQFVAMFAEFRKGDIDVETTMTRVPKLFEGYPALIQGYNTFLPEGQRIDVNILDNNEYTATIITPKGSNPIGNPDRVKIINANLPKIEKDENSPFERAKEGMAFMGQFMGKLTTRYKDNPNITKQFLEILQKYNTVLKDVPDSNKLVESEVKELLKDEPELVEEFKTFWRTVSERPKV